MQSSDSSEENRIPKVHGYVERIPCQDEDLEQLTSLKGDYVLDFTDKESSVLVSSSYSVLPYYYAVAEGTLLHGPTVSGVMRDGGWSNDWDYNAIANVFETYHVLGDQTLHPKIKRVPARSMMKHQAGRLDVRSLPWAELEEKHPVEDSMVAFERAAARECTSDAIVSMSAGFDSRTILGAALKSGARPALLTMGAEDSTDVTVSRSIAGELGLPLEIAPVVIDDYWEQAEKIVSITGGTKSADNWHTFHYCQRSSYPSGSPILLGANGEFVRAYFLGRRNLAMVALLGSVLPRQAVRAFWDKKRYRGFQVLERAMTDPLREEVVGTGVDRRAELFMETSAGSLWEGLDRFYLVQRVRNFIGNGLALVADKYSCRMPFLDRDWVGAASHLGLGWKVGSNWHREMIARCPGNLLGFPEEGTDGNMRRRQSFLDASFARKRGSIGYAPNEPLLCSDRARRYLMDGAEYLEGLFEPEPFREIVEATLPTMPKEDQVRIVGALVALVTWGKITRK